MARNLNGRESIDPKLILDRIQEMIAKGLDRVSVVVWILVNDVKGYGQDVVDRQLEDMNLAGAKMAAARKAHCDDVVDFYLTHFRKGGDPCA